MAAIKTELLAPAGSPEALDAAVGEGADAVYLGLKDFNARMRSANFSYSQFEGALRSLHRMGRRLYVTVNTVFQQREADRVFQLLKYLAGLGPDGIMVQDFGIVTMAQENFPSLKLLASTQMNVASAPGANLLSRHGISRVILARELSLDEIREIRANTNMELEVFVHGALCISVSGICLFSSYLGGKSANRGMCTQACRRFYTAWRPDGRPWLPISARPEGANTANSGKGFWDPAGESGGYYFSPADLELVENIPDLVKAGVYSFKIEGRMKSAEYVGTVVSAYRLVLDNLDAGEESLNRKIAEARNILKNDFARPKTVYLINGTGEGKGATVDWLNPKQSGGTGIPGNTGIDWLNPKQSGGTGIPGNTGIDWLNPKQSGGTGIPLGKILRVRGRGEERQALIQAGTMTFCLGDSIRLHKSDDSDRVSHKLDFVEDGPPEGCWISIPEGFGPGDAVYLIQTRAMTKRYAPVIKRSSGNGRVPGRDKTPLPAGSVKNNKTGYSKSRSKDGKETDLAEGFYAMVSRIEDLYVLQSSRPVKAILPYSHKLKAGLLGSREQALPFPARDLILSLDPFFPQERERELGEDISALISKGYTRFIVNNLGHFSLFRKTKLVLAAGAKSERAKLTLIAGPWLYVFNAWAWAFISKCGAEYCVSPLENNRQNLERSFSGEGHFSDFRSDRLPDLRAKVFVTIFTRPSLFRIRSNLYRVYDFENFTGTRDEAFRLDRGPEGTLVYPREPFSIVDKTPFLREAGFSRFILDFSSGLLKKAEYRDIMEAVNRAAPLPGTSRFNWKDGFYRNAK